MKVETETLAGDVQRVILEGRLDTDGVQEIDIRFTAMTTARKGQIVVDLSAHTSFSPA